MKIIEICNECTTSGSVAAIATPLGQTLYRNPSIYDNVGSYEEPKKKKTKNTKYITTKDKD
jgi:hypothetical protein